ncbi:hypothetical protein MAPG_11301 [Magnaporthiopsis poae ATCC 64411]|uniref:Uncharacterized protein n=1 Tax=Magnaporthiopsis poae (strain ATCC 64411 / 73-15) TaxID=644358 RepID=A0A0C4EEW9_MAGP6|nr:hypothetical protein MAPG_11301 [Magnaporthiopsis poae ATCC 64411]
MAEPFSIAASAISLAAIAAHTSRVLSNFCSEVKHAPALVVALSNEVNDLKLVLDKVSSATSSLAAPTASTPGPSTSSSNVAMEARLRDMLARAKNLLVELDILSRQLSGLDTAAQRIKWQFSKTKVENLKDRLRSTSRSLMHIMVSSNLASSTRIELELHNISVIIPQSHGPTLQTLGTLAADTKRAFDCLESSVANNHQQIQEALAADRELSLPIARDVSSIKESMAANTAAADSQAVGLRNIMTVLGSIHSATQQNREILLALGSAAQEPMMPSRAEQDAPLPRAAHHLLATQRHGLPTPNSPVPIEPLIQIAVVPTNSSCGQACGCRCHIPRASDDASLKLPAPLRSLFGQLLLGYAGSLTTRSSCDQSTCRRGKYARLRLSYSFPAWFASHKVSLLLEASTSRRFMLGLVARRRVPLWAGDFLAAANDFEPERVVEILKLNPSKILDVDTRTGRSALHLVAGGSWTWLDYNDWIQQIEMLVQAGADPDYEDDNGDTAKKLFARCVLQMPGYQPGKSGWLLPSFVRNALDLDLELSYLQKILLGICPVDLETVLSHGGQEVLAQIKSPGDLDCPPLVLAARLDNAVAVRSLLRAGARNEIPVHQGFSMHAAAALKSHECLRALLEVVGFDMEKPNRGGLTPLMVAIEAHSTPCTMALLEAGADVHARDIDGFTPLHCAARVNNMAAARVLLKRGVPIDALANGGFGTPLIVAVRYNCLELQRYLIQMGADLVSTAAGTGWTILDVAAFIGNEETLDHIASINLSVFDIENKDSDIEFMRRLFDRRLIASPEEREAFERLIVAYQTAHDRDPGNDDVDDTVTEWSSEWDSMDERDGSNGQGVTVAGGDGTEDEDGAASESSGDWLTAEEDNGDEVGSA